MLIYYGFRAAKNYIFNSFGDLGILVKRYTAKHGQFNACSLFVW